MAYVHTVESLKGQNLGFPLRPHFKRFAPFFMDKIACMDLQKMVSVRGERGEPSPTT
jgi:hypothetical protein